MGEYTRFGALLSQAREDRTRSRYQVARNVGVSMSFLARIERGDGLPSLLVLAMLWRLLGFDANAVLDALGVKTWAIPAGLRTRKGKAQHARMTQGRHARFGSLVAQKRVLAELTQAALGYAAGISERFLARIEAGVQLPSVLVAARLRAALELDGNEMLAALVDTTPREPFHAFGRILEVARTRCELQPVDVAKAAQCPTAMYQRWERGAELPTVRGLARVHRVLRFHGSAALHAVWVADEQSKEVA